MDDSAKFDVLSPTGEYITMLNPRLAARQKVTDDQLQALRASHVVRRAIFDVAEANRTHPTTLRMLATLFAHLESQQQELWNFGANPDFQRFFDLPGCTCPKMDNAERLGTPYKIYDPGCPIHGDKE